MLPFLRSLMHPSYLAYLKAAEHFWRMAVSSVFDYKGEAKPQQWLSSITVPFHRFLMKHLAFKMKRVILSIAYKPGPGSRSKFLRSFVLDPLKLRLEDKFSAKNADALADAVWTKSHQDTASRSRKNAASKKRRQQKRKKPVAKSTQPRKRRRRAPPVPPALLAFIQ